MLFSCLHALQSLYHCLDLLCIVSLCCSPHTKIERICLRLFNWKLHCSEACAKNNLAYKSAGLSIPLAAHLTTIADVRCLCIDSGLSMFEASWAAPGCVRQRAISLCSEEREEKKKSVIVL